MGHNRENFGALLKSIIGNFKSIIGSGLFVSEQEEWPPDKPKHFTNVMLIHHKSRCTEKELRSLLYKIS